MGKSSMKLLTKEWLEKATDDFIVIHAIIDNDLVTNMVAFHAQQAIEKTFKALLEEHEVEIKKVHNLLFLFKKVKPFISLNLDMDVLILLDQLYIDARYPGELGLLPDGKPSPSEAKIFYTTAQDIFSRVSDFLT
jgi:HEPN domain-containing protein